MQREKASHPFPCANAAAELEEVLLVAVEPSSAT
jgi:hypothetical protein